MKSILLKILSLSTIICILICIIYQVYFYYNNPYETMIISVSSIEKKSFATGLFYKDETVLNLEESGNIIKNIHPDGTKLAVDSKVARIYQTKEDAKNFEKLNLLKENLKNLEKVQNEDLQNNLNFVDLNKQIYENYEKLLYSIRKKDFDCLEEIKQKLTFLFNTKQMMVNKNVNFINSINSLKEEIKKIENKTNKPKIAITKESGFFVGNTDGLEKEFSLQKINDLTNKEFEEKLKKTNNEIKDNKSVKIITSSKIFFKVLMPTKDLIGQKLNTNYKIYLKETGEKIETILHATNINLSDENSTAIFEIYDINDKIAKLRKSEAEIIFYENEVLKIPKTALRTNKNNELGVYVLEKTNIKFKKVNILYEDECFAICSLEIKDKTKESQYVKNLDKIIIKGRNLYDGKQIKNSQQ